jgi:hypothetical protein
MGLRRLKNTTPPDDVLEEHVHSYAMANADPQASAVAPKFAGLIQGWKACNEERVDLIVAAATAAAVVVQVDIRLDAAVAELLRILEKLDPDHQTDLWDLFLKGVQPAVFVRPILSRQLAKMTLWPAAIADLSYPELTAYAATLAPLLVEAKQAEDAADQAAQRLRNWRTVGGFSEHLALANAERTDAHGTLADIPFHQPALRLPKDYADRFFLHDTTRRGAGKARTSAQIRQEMSDLQGQLADLDGELTAALAREADAAKREADAAKDREELAALKKQREGAKAREKLLEKKLGKSKSKKK